MNLIFKITVTVAALTILLWIAIETFVSSSQGSSFGAKVPQINSGSGTYDPQNHTAAGFKDFEDRKAFVAEEKKAKKLKAKELKAKEKTPNVVASANTQRSSNKLTAQALQQTSQAQLSETKAIPASTNIQAIDAVLSVENSSNCHDNYVAGVFFNKKSASLRGQSLLALDVLIKEHRKCLNSVFLVNSTMSDESTFMLDQRRRDEVKYYLLQRSVDKSAIKLTE